MKKEDILKKSRELFVERKFEEIIEVVTKNNIYTEELMLFLAISYSLKKEPDFYTSNDILLNYFDEPPLSPLYHFSLGYNFFFMNEYGMALEHFELSKMLDDEFMNVDQYIADCRDFLKYPVVESFISRVDKFWKKFLDIEIIIRTEEDCRDFLGYLFETFFEDISVSFDCIMNRKINRVYIHSFYDRTDAFKIYLILLNSPKLSKFEFIYGIKDDKKVYNLLKESIVNTININSRNIYASYEYLEEDIVLDVYNEELWDYAYKNKDEAIQYIKEYIELYFGSSFRIMYISNIRIVNNKEGLKPLYNIKKELKLKYKAVSLSDYLFKRYEFKTEMINLETIKLRDDIYSGYTMIPELYEEYNLGIESGAVTEFERAGIICGFVYYNNDDINYYNKEEFRVAIENKIKEEFKDKGLVIGGYLGSENSYIDIMAFDLDYCVDKLREIAEVMNIGEVCFSVFRQSMDVLSLTYQNLNPTVYSSEDEKKIIDHIQKNFGVIQKIIKDDPSDDIRVDINIIYPTKKRNYYTLVTNGIGAKSMKVPHKYNELNIDRAELVITLPPDWNINSREEKWFWPILFLRNLARSSFEQEAWLGVGHTIYMGKGFLNEKVDGFVLATPLLYGIDSSICRINHGKDVNFYSLVLLHSSEIDYMTRFDLGELLKLFETARMSLEDIFVLNYKRHNVSIDKNLI